MANDQFNRGEGNVRAVIFKFEIIKMEIENFGNEFRPLLMEFKNRPKFYQESIDFMAGFSSPWLTTSNQAT